MSSTSHPTVGLQQEYRDGLCSAGVALLVATHLELCPELAGTMFKPWGGRNLPGVLAADYPGGGEVYAQALGPAVLEDWRGDGGVRFASLKGAAGLGEAAYLVEVAPGASAKFPDTVLLLVVLRGVLKDEVLSFARGAFVDVAAMPFLAPEGDGAQGCTCLVICEAA